MNALTDEEKQKIVEEEQLRTQIRNQQNKQGAMKRKISGPMGCLLIILALIFVPFFIFGLFSRSPAKETTPNPSPPASHRPQNAPQTQNVQYEVIDTWIPDEDTSTYGMDILLQDELTEDEMVAFVQERAGTKDPVIIRIYTNREAYEAITNDAIAPTTDADENGYILHYVRNSRAGTERITWFQEIGQFSDLYGTTTDLK